MCLSMLEETATPEFIILRSIATEKLEHQPFNFEEDSDGKTQ